MRGNSIHYEVLGDGSPVVILHGRPGDHRYLMPTLEPIFSAHKGWKRVYVDFPGTAQTRMNERISGNDQVLDVTLDLVNAVIPGEHFALIGHSYGAYIARGIITKAPSIVDGLFLWAPTIRKPRSEMNRPGHVVLARDPIAASELPSNELEREMFDDVLVVQSKEARDYIRTHLVPSMRNASRMSGEAYEVAFRFPMETQIFEKPTLIVCGRQDSVVGYQDAFGILESFPRATFSVLDMAGHLIGLVEQAELFRALVGEWLSRVKEGIAARGPPN